MGLKFKVENIDEVAEAQREFYTERDGAYYLDIEGMPSSKTDDDVRRLNGALEKERKDHKATREKLKAFEDFGTPEELREKIDEYDTLKDGGGKANEELLDYKKRLRTAEKERDSFKTQFESQKTRLDELIKLEKASKVKGKLKEIVESLDAKYDRNKINSMLEDFEDNFDLDDVGDIAPYKGKAVKEWIQARADLYNFTVNSTPGKSNPGNINSVSADAAKQKAYDEAKANGDSLAMLNNLPLKQN